MVIYVLYAQGSSYFLIRYVKLNDYNEKRQVCLARLRRDLKDLPIAKFEFIKSGKELS